MKDLIKVENLEQNAIFVGDRESFFENLPLLCGKYLGANIDFYKIHKFEISVDDVRTVRDWCYGSSADGLKVVILSSFNWNESMQNALLKLLEDTPPYVKIFLLSGSSSGFLSTILSRVFLYDFSDYSEDKKIVREILKKEKYLRLQDSKVKKILAAKVVNKNILDMQSKESNSQNENEDDGNEDRVEENAEQAISKSSSRKDKEVQQKFYENLVSVILEKWRSERSFFEIDFIKKINSANTEIGSYGASPHFYIEYFLLTTPVFGE